MRWCAVWAGAVGCVVGTWCGIAGAQQPAPGYPPPGYGYPPPGYGYPPPGAYPPGYYYPAPTAPTPPTVRPSAWKEGDPIPPGYHVEEQVRRGMVIAGAITLGVPYLIGLSIASSADFENSSGWLAVPALGPWLTIAFREDQCDEENNPYASDAVDCASDTLVRIYLTIDGLAQTTGAILFTVGMLDRKQRLVADSTSRFSISPSRVGRGYGLRLQGVF